MIPPFPAFSSPGPSYLSGLNPPQREAVEALDGPVLVLAGAGTGKTRVLTTRLAHLLKTGKAFPGQILAVTFTNKAAAEMKIRVSTLLDGQPVEGWWLGTFHALAARMLRVHAEKVGLTRDFTIIDPDDQLRLFKSICEVEGIDPKKWAPKMLLAQIDRWKDRALSPEDITAAEAGDLAGGRLPLLYRRYQDRLKTVNACDFGDLLLHMIRILKNPAYGDVLADYHRKFRYLLVDEYQDTNTAQYLWLRLLAAGSGNLCCVGDDDQSIYGWRGAEIGNILKFEHDFPRAKVIRLEQNYRSTNHILSGAGGVIAHNQGRLGKTLWSDEGAGEKIQVHGVWDGEAEARLISEMIERKHRAGESYARMAILVRAGFQMREFEDRFLQIGLPYRVFGGPRFYERAEIRDALAYFRALVQPRDDLALERIINVPKRGIGDTTVAQVQAFARARDLSLQAAIHEMLGGGDLKPKVKGVLSTLMGDFDRWRSLLGDGNHADISAQILDESGYTAMWKAEKTPDAEGRLENLKELVATLADYPSLPAFLEHVALVMENAEDAGAESVSLMTLHAAKGLEFDTVFLPGWEEGLFPSQRSVDENGLRGLEEERRLAYVGLTRARRLAVISFAGSRRMYGNWVNNIPSRFVTELPADHVEAAGAQGLFGSTAVAAPTWEGAVRSALPSRKALSAYVAGTRVTHETFGVGTVIHAEGNKLDIQFDDGSHKRVMAGFVDPL